jgi:hypothetical protein
MTSAMLQPAGPRIGGGSSPPIKPRVSAGSLFRPPHALGAAAASLSEPNEGRISDHTRSASEGPSESPISVFRPPHSRCSPLSTSATQSICPYRQNICPAAIQATARARRGGRRGVSQRALKPPVRRIRGLPPKGRIASTRLSMKARAPVAGRAARREGIESGCTEYVQWLHIFLVSMLARGHPSRGVRRLGGAACASASDPLAVARRPR